MINLKISFSIILFLFFCHHLVIAQCGDDGHSTNAKDSWLSCQTTMIPNSSASDAYHWIYYDLGYNYPLGTVQVWNYNVENETANGIKDGEIFYSADGQNWDSGGTFQIPEASGQADYPGWEGIDLKGVVARYITITAYNNWGNEICTGLSEIRFNVGEQVTSLIERALPSSEMLVFPNPTNQVVSVSLKNNQQIKELIIVNNAGHELFRRQNQTDNFSTDVSSFPAGMYYIKVWTMNQTYLVHKFVKTDL